MRSSSPFVRLTKIFTFEMAHALEGYDGPCKNIHGHSYELSVTVKGKPLTDSKDPKHGMVIDFSVLTKIVSDSIISKYDHALVLKRGSKHITTPSDKTIVANYQPTCENLLIDYAQIISKSLPKNISLHNLKLRETAKSYAEWFAEDN